MADFHIFWMIKKQFEAKCSQEVAVFMRFVSALRMNGWAENYGGPEVQTQWQQNKNKKSWKTQNNFTKQKNFSKTNQRRKVIWRLSYFTKKGQKIKR